MYLFMWLFGKRKKKTSQSEEYREATQTESGFAFLHGQKIGFEFR